MLDQEDWWWSGLLVCCEAAASSRNSAVWLPQSWTACGNAARLYNCYCNDYCPAQARPKVRSQDFAAAADSPPKLSAVLPAARYSSQTCNMPTTQGFLAYDVTDCRGKKNVDCCCLFLMIQNPILILIARSGICAHYCFLAPQP